MKGNTMHSRVFAVYDTKAEAFLAPFVMQNRGLALRGFIEIVNDPSTQFYKHPGDFALFELACYDETKGVFENNQTPVNLGLAQEFRREQPLAPHVAHIHQRVQDATDGGKQ